MFAFIRGILIQATPTSLIVEASGIGYKIFIPASVFSQLPQINQPVLLHTSLISRELSQTLYGFLVSQERDLFESLMSVSGVGPKLALSLIGHLSMQALHLALIHRDIAAFCKVPGIGKKTAERLIVELRDKIQALMSTDSSEYVQASNDPRTQAVNDAMSALINLGYNQITAQKAIKKTLNDAQEDIELAELITVSLKHI